MPVSLTPTPCRGVAARRRSRNWAMSAIWCGGPPGRRGLPQRSWARLEGWAPAHPAAAEALFAEAIALREAIYRIFHALACGEAVADPDLAALNRALAAAPPRHRVGPAGAGFGWQIETAQKPRRRCCWRRCCGRRATFWPATGAGAFACAPMSNACGCSSTRARPAPGAGATWPLAAIAPRRAATIGGPGPAALQALPSAASSPEPAPAPAAGCPSRARS